MKKSLILFLSLLVIAGHAQLVEYNYICPVPDSRYINPEQTLILKTGVQFNPRSIHEAFVSMKGSVSGHFLTVMSLSQDLKTLFIHHNKKFALGESIHVFISSGLETIDGKAIRSTHFHFTIREHNLLPLLNNYYQQQQEEISQSPVNRNSHDNGYSGRDNNLPPDYPAPVDVYTGEGIAEGYTFVTPSVRMAPQYSNYITIWDKHGIPIYYQKRNYTMFDFKVIDEGILAYANGSYQNAELKRYYLMDGNYEITDSILAGNGYYIDNHDMQLLENGHYLILIYDPQVVDMSVIVEGGYTDAIVTGLVIQEVDNLQNVFFQWRSWDHFEITDATDDVNLLAHQIDYVHGNALDIDSDGHILLSSRNMDEITKINFNTGDIIWRFGLNADNNQFTLIDDPVGFSHQHDIRKIDNGNYTIFDNGNLHTPQLSRGMEYEIDEQNMVATLVWDYIHTPAIYASSTGSTRRLSNNNTLIGWGGSTPYAFTEVDEDDQVVFEVTMPTNVAGYRVLKYPWTTTAFHAQQNIDFGNYQDVSHPKEYYLTITNNLSHVIQLNSAHNHSDNYFVDNLPITIPVGESRQISVFFQPDKEGLYEDILTVNYDNYDNTRRIARQINLSGLNDPDLPAVTFDPVNGSVDVDPHTEIIVTFSEPVRGVFGQELEDDDVPSLFIFNESSLFGNGIPFHGTINDDKTVITIFPDEPLDPEQQYYVQLLPNKLSDYQGNIIDYSDYSFFTTGNLVSEVEAHYSSGITVFPNPLENNLFIKSAKARIKKAEVYSEDGKMVFSGSFDERNIRINTVNFPEGLLIIKVHTMDGYKHTRRLVRLD